MVMSLLIRYTHIPFYFRFSITSSTSLIHHYAPPYQHNCTQFHSHLLIWSTHVLWFTCFISILSIPNVCPPVVWPITNPHTTWSGTFYSFTSDELYAPFLVDHSYLTCLYLPFKPHNHPYKFPPEFKLSTCALHHFASHHTASQSYHLYLFHHTWRWSLTPRSHPQSHIGFILRSPAP